MYLRSLYRCACLLAFCQFAVTPVHAADNQQAQTNYAVDIVVFEDSQARYLNSEKWPLPPRPSVPSAPAQTAVQQPADTSTISITPAQPAQSTASSVPTPTSTTSATPAEPATDSTTAAANTTVPGPLKIPPTDVFLSNPGGTPQAPGSTDQTATANTAASTGAQNAATATAPGSTNPGPDIHAIDPGKYDLLNDDVKKLIASPDYHILVRKSWIQPGLDSQQGVSIDMSSVDDPESAGAIGTLSGSVKIVLERYLHLYTDLVYHRPSTDITPAGDSPTPPMPQVQDFVIKQHRRMRSNELHYLDHPLVGILIKIVPVEMNSDSQPAQ